MPEGGAQKTGHNQASGAQNIAQSIINTVHPMHFEKYHYSSRILRDSFLCLPAFRAGAVAGMTVLLTAIRTCPITAGTNNMKPVITYIEGAFWMEA